MADRLGHFGINLGERALEVVGLESGHAVTVANRGTVASEVLDADMSASPTQGGLLVGMVRGHLQIDDLVR